MANISFCTGVVATDTTSSATITGGTINSTPIGGSSPSTIAGTVITAGTSVVLPTGTLLGVANVRASASQSLTTQTTLQDMTGFSFAIAANEVWTGTATLQFGAALATTGLKLAIAGPASTALDLSTRVNADTLSLTALYYQATATLGATLDFTILNLAAALSGSVQINFVVAASSIAGTVKIQFAQSTSSATALTLLKGSTMSATRIA